LTPEEKKALHDNEYDKNIHDHCTRGKNLLHRSSVFKRSSEIIGCHHTRWQEWDRTVASPLTIPSQILFLSDTIERFINRNTYILHQSQDITTRIAALAGSDFHPEIVEAYKTLSPIEEFWLDIVSPSVKDLLREESPVRNTVLYQSDFMEISEVLRNIIDFRSHFTATHSTGVSSAAGIIARIMGYSESEVEMMQLAGNLHDLGKLPYRTVSLKSRRN
jgi:response regulator RpfG family c-di-GMP phosphodiesterase